MDQKEAYEIIKWFVENDETNEGDWPVDELGGQTWDQVNAFWIEGLNRARNFIQEYEANNPQPLPK